MTHLRTVSVLLLACLVSACGGGSGSGTGAPPPAQDKVTFAGSTTLTVGASANIEPQVSGSATITSWSISPSLSAGLLLNSTSGVIGGTPTAIAAATTYTVTATYQGGSASTTLSIQVNDVAPAISYAEKDATFAANSPAPTLVPTNTGGAVVSWSVSPDLPSGLTLNAKTGAISGTPTSTERATSYTITAQNSGGVSTFSLALSVGTLLLDLGNQQGIQVLRMTGTRVLGFDAAHFWALWDYTSGKEIASGLASCSPSGCNPFIDLEGETLAVETSAGLEVFSATDGSLSTVITSPVRWWEVATDGSYICGSGTAGLTVWSASGAVVTSLPGDFSSAKVFAAPNQVQVAAGPAGANVIQTVTLPSGAATVSSAFQGQFASWFRDGGRFLTNTGTTVWIYSSSAAQQDIISFAGGIQDLGGEGAWFWNCGQNCTELDVYKVGASSSAAAAYPVATDTSIVPSGPTIGLLAYGTGSGVLVDLSGTSPAATNFTTPVPFLSAYAATSPSRWLVGNSVLLDGASLSGTRRYFGYGRAWSIAGSGQRLALATASGQVLYFDAGTLAEEGTIDFPATEVALSSDGSVLAAAGDLEDYQYAPTVALHVYSLPSGTQTYTWPYTVGSPPYLEDFTLSGSGSTVGQVIDDPTNTNLCVRQVTAANGGPDLWSDSLCSNFKIYNDRFPIRLSADGTWVAVSQAGTTVAYTTNLYHNGSLVTAVPGWVVGWLDGSHILVNNYTLPGVVTSGTNEYINSTVYDTTGTKVTDLPIPVELKSLQVVDASSIYDPGSNAIYSTITGAATWTGSQSTGVGAVAGSNVVAVYGTQVIAVPY